ncbi:Omega-amidase NIT2 [Seminavis robusta]|uniref:Omega-amidase NIT2 n=1 Tax=Seminavis robusta TaxID=568900 RepID=A0A9N8D781_9STRA|nr:Omega-amidase NIT2 [Seminavis robusta]|eukprot:Sro19_g013300.1 Omega-amidase NIT2 (352) ;mRNA; r:31703-32758
MRLSYHSLTLWISTTAASAASASAFHSRPAFFTRIGSQQFRQSSSTVRSMSSTSADTLRVALCQFHVTPDKEKNHATAADYLDRAAAQGAQLVVLPEIWNSPYATSAFAEYAEVLPQVGDTQATTSPSSALLMERAKQHKMWIVGGSIPETDDGQVYNTCLVYDPTGTVVAKHRKVHLFDIDVPGGITFRESDTLSPGNSLTSFALRDDLDVGVGICYDIRFPLASMLMCQSKPNCKIIIFPGAFNLTTGPAHWELLQRGRALDNQCFVITASPARTQPPEEEGKYPHYTAWGHSTVVSPWGDVVTKAEEKEALVICDLDLARVDEVRTSIPIGKQKRTDLYKLEDVKSSS